MSTTNAACAHCDTSWPSSTAPEFCAACGAYPDETALALQDPIIAGVRARFVPWGDRQPFEDWVARNAERVRAGGLCSCCGTLMSTDDKRGPPGRPERCIVCIIVGGSYVSPYGERGVEPMVFDLDDTADAWP